MACRCFANSFCLSADVTAAFDPNFPEVSEKRNDAKLNYGMGICKFTGARGKSGTSDASAEVVAYLRKLFADNGVVWQMSELGKVDLAHLKGRNCGELCREEILLDYAVAVV